ncbi:MAG: isoprenyl transferase [Verrucomicrobiota bacterium]|nr:isoprenyl transferase [Verrucomicrobiota bacterium]
MSSPARPARSEPSPAESAALSAKIPRHVAIIMDGNGRWAKQRRLPRIEGHRRGVETVRDIVNAARDLGIRCLTLYAFSAENWQRPADEVGALMSLLEFFLKREIKNLVKNRVRLRTIGRIHELPGPVQTQLQRALDATAHFTDYTLVLALNYGSRTEIVDAARAYAAAVASGREKLNDSSWATFSRYLYTADLPDPDLIIRTSGETRVSNFLLLQSAYAEFVFTPVLWPDFTRADLAAAMATFAARERRFGLTGEQIQPPDK